MELQQYCGVTAFIIVVTQISVADVSCLSQNQIIKLMLREKPQDRPEASQLKAELEKWAQMSNAQNVRQENATI